MKYYSEILRKNFDSEKDCLAAEKDHSDKVAAEKAKQTELANARKERAKEVETAYQAVLDAQKHYTELRNQFVKDYGSWHMTISSHDDFDDLFDMFFRIF